MSDWSEIYSRIAFNDDNIEDEAEHYKRIKEMRYPYEIPEHVREMCLKLKEHSKKLKLVVSNQWQ